MAKAKAGPVFADDFIPSKLGFLIDEKAPYKVIYGGRNGTRSWSCARGLIYHATQAPYRILCAREYQTNISESVHRLLSDQIYMLGLSRHFRILQQTIQCLATGAQFIFAGIRTDPQEIKSMERINFCWVEEAALVTKESWDYLLPTVREHDSEFWITFNPRLANDETWKRFVVNPPAGAIVCKTTYRDNPWFTEQEDRKRLDFLRNDPQSYDNIWEGEPGLLGDAFFPKEYLDEAAKSLLPPLATGYLEQVGDQIRFRAAGNGWLEIWELPNDQWDYVNGADVSEGTTDGDQHSGHILRRDPFRSYQVARFAPNVALDDFGRYSVLASKFFTGRVPTAIERTGGWGIAAIIAAQDTGYPHLFRMPKGSATMTEDVSDKIGWETTQTSRPELLSRLYGGLRDRTLIIRSEKTWNQFQTFVKAGRGGKPQAASNCCDDEVMGLGIAYSVLHLSHPIPRAAMAGGGSRPAGRDHGKLGYMGA